MLAARSDPRDALVARAGLTLSTLPEKAVIGTSSVRRRAQLLHWRPDLAIVSLRGNVDTRLRKLETEGLDGIIVAAAGLLRLGWEARVSDIIPPEICMPAVIGSVRLGLTWSFGPSEMCCACNRSPMVATVVAATGNHYVLDAVAGAALGVAARRISS